ncbi:MAG TPA: hypothetical protein VN408_05380 [Actinoplanes sp.]|nr:hypothetical protein [Actinoplanes sp.]
MRTLNPDELARLAKSDRQLKVSALVVVVMMFAVLGVAVASGAPQLAGLSGPLGIGVAAMMLGPHRRLVEELGLTRREAKRVLREQRRRQRASAGN